MGMEAAEEPPSPTGLFEDILIPDGVRCLLSDQRSIDAQGRLDLLD
jgi:hypothetical protein